MNGLSASFERKAREAAGIGLPYAAGMIRTHMNRSDWATLLILAAMWGAAFMFIGMAVREVSPLTYVWLRVTIAAAAMWAWVAWRGERHGLPRGIWGAILFLALFNNVIPFILFGWGQTHIASGLASILNATTPIWGVVVAHFFTADEKISPRKLAGVLLGFGGVALMIGPALLHDLGSNALAQLADQFGESRLDMHVNVFERRILGHAVTRIFVGDVLQAPVDRFRILGRDDALPAEHRRMGPAAEDVFAPQSLVGCDRAIYRAHEFGRPARKAAAPHRIGVVLAVDPAYPCLCRDRRLR